MVLENFTKRIDTITDQDFDLIYSPTIRALSSRHWTPVNVSKKAVDFLCYKDNIKILDVGSGVGKFSIIGALLKSNGSFYGVDFRKEFIQISDNIKENYQIKNVSFIHQEFSELDFNVFDGIYFFNSFHERIDRDTVIDEFSETSYDLYKKYTQDFFLKMNSLPEGTRLVTYHTEDIYIPYTYRIIDKCFEGKLKFYIKCLDE